MRIITAPSIVTVDNYGPTTACSIFAQPGLRQTRSGSGRGDRINEGVERTFLSVCPPAVVPHWAVRRQDVEARYAWVQRPGSHVSAVGLRVRRRESQGLVSYGARP